MLHPVIVVLIGMTVVIGAIVLLRMNAFLALIGAAIVVSLLAPGDAAIKITRVAEGFGRTAASIAIVIALAAVIGQAMMDSGAADRIVDGFLSLLGEKRGAAALGATGFTLSIPVFFDTVFFLLVPLARSMYGRTGREYLKYVMAIAGGAAATHTLVPPTPGPLAVATALGVDLGTMMLVGLLVAVPAASAGFVFAGWSDRRTPLHPPAAETAVDVESTRRVVTRPSLLSSILPIALPVLLISSNTIALSLAGPADTRDPFWSSVTAFTGIVGNPNAALMLAAGVAIWLYVRQRAATREDVARMTEQALMSAGMIILITAAGGAFGATLQAAQIGPAIQTLFASDGGSALVMLSLGFGIASLMKIAQGSSTVAMITTAAMMGAMLQSSPSLPFHPVYIATAISAGSLVGTWMNDSGFWVFSKMGGVSEVQTLRTWTPLAAIVGVTAMATTLALSFLMPLK